MGNAALYWTPFSGTPQVLDLGEPLTDLFWEPEREASDGTSILGGQTRALGLGRLRVFASLDRMAGGIDLAYRLRTLQSHLERGGRVGLTADTDKSFAAFLSSQPGDGDTRLDWAFQPWASTVGGARSLVAGDHVAVQTPSPQSFRAFPKVQTFSASGRYLTMSEPFPGWATARPALVRWAYYFPSLVMPEDALGRALVAGEHGFLHSLSLELVEDWGALAADADAAQEQGLGWGVDDFGAFLVDQDGDRYVPHQESTTADPWNGMD